MTRCEAISVFTRVNGAGPHIVRFKAGPARGKKPAAWVQDLHQDLRDDFNRLHKLDVKSNP